jgi:hypothetical protein
MRGFCQHSSRIISLLPAPVVPEAVVPEEVVTREEVVPEEEVAAREEVVPEPEVPEPVVPEVPKPVVPEPEVPEAVVPEPEVLEPVVPEPVVPEAPTVGLAAHVTGHGAGGASRVRVSRHGGGNTRGRHGDGANERCCHQRLFERSQRIAHRALPSCA